MRGDGSNAQRAGSFGGHAFVCIGRGSATPVMLHSPTAPACAVPEQPATAPGPKVSAPADHLGRRQHAGGRNGGRRFPTSININDLAFANGGRDRCHGIRTDFLAVLVARLRAMSARSMCSALPMMTLIPPICSRAPALSPRARACGPLPVSAGAANHAIHAQPPPPAISPPHPPLQARMQPLVRATEDAPARHHHSATARIPAACCPAALR